MQVVRDLPERIQEKLATMPEYRQGVHRVVATLDDGTEIRDVFVAWGSEVVRVGESEEIDFDPGRVVEVRSQC